jgi:hypothetical protein
VEVAVPPALDDTGLTSTPHDSTRSLPIRLVLLCALVVALLASAVVLVWLVSDRRGAADDLQSERETAMAQARQLVLRVGTYGPDQLEGQQMPEYREQVSELMTDKLAADFEKNGAPLAEQTVAQTRASRSAEVFSTGVSAIDDDSATVLVAGAFQTTFPARRGQEVQQPDPTPFRYVVDLNKVDGTWLVDGYDAATEAAQ